MPAAHVHRDPLLTEVAPRLDDLDATLGKLSAEIEKRLDGDYGRAEGDVQQLVALAQVSISHAASIANMPEPPFPSRWYGLAYLTWLALASDDESKGHADAADWALEAIGAIVDTARASMKVGA